MHIINVVQTTQNQITTLYVVTVGNLAKDVAVYYEDVTHKPSFTEWDVAHHGDKLPVWKCKKMEGILLTGLMHELPEDWYYRD